PNAVMVNARRTGASLNGALNLVFGTAFGVNTVDVSRQAIAVTGGFTGGGLIVLSPTAHCALNLSGSSIVVGNGGGVQVNSGDPCAVCSNGGPSFNVPDLYVHGGAGCLGSG